MAGITGGDCFQAALRTVMDMSKKEQDGCYVVHGYPMGQGDIEGVRFVHAWVERTEGVLTPDGTLVHLDIVIDNSNGKSVEMPKVMYYKLGKIDPDEVVQYDVQEAFLKAVTAGHYGPWDLERTEEELEFGT